MCVCLLPHSNKKTDGLLGALELDELKLETLASPNDDFFILSGCIGGLFAILARSYLNSPLELSGAVRVS